MTRETWGSVKEVAGKRIQVSFLMGKPLPPEPKAKKVMLSDGEYSRISCVFCLYDRL